MGEPEHLQSFTSGLLHVLGSRVMMTYEDCSIENDGKKASELSIKKWVVISDPYQLLELSNHEY